VNAASHISRRREIELDDLTGLCAAEAIDRLRALELRPAVEAWDVEDRSEHGVVVAHDPPKSSQVRRSELITLLVGQHAVPAPTGRDGSELSDTPSRAEVRSSVPTVSTPFVDAPVALTGPADWSPRTKCDHGIEGQQRTDRPVVADVRSATEAVGLPRPRLGRRLMLGRFAALLLALAAVVVLMLDSAARVTRPLAGGQSGAGTALAPNASSRQRPSAGGEPSSRRATESARRPPRAAYRHRAGRPVAGQPWARRSRAAGVSAVHQLAVIATPAVGASPAGSPRAATAGDGSPAPAIDPPSPTGPSPGPLPNVTQGGLQ
jgi:hypothetical protein